MAYALEYGAPTTDQSALNLVYLLGEQPPGGHLSLTGMSDERFRIAGGNDRLPQAMAAKLCRRTRCASAGGSARSRARATAV